MGKSIFVQSDDNRLDDYRSLKSRADAKLKGVDPKDDKKYRIAACEEWFDVRAFGQVFAYKGKNKKGKGKDEGEDKEGNRGESKEGGKGSGVSIGIRGPVSVHPAFSVAKVENRIIPTQITKSVNLEGDDGKMASDRIGMKHRVDHGVYVFYGSMNTQLATKTGFSDDDAKAIKEVIKALFRNDASSARPEGSMEVHKVYWWEHNNLNGQYSSAKVHRLIDVKPNKDDPNSIEDYTITLNELPGLKCEVIEGE